MGRRTAPSTICGPILGDSLAGTLRTKLWQVRAHCRYLRLMPPEAWSERVRTLREMAHDLRAGAFSIRNVDVRDKILTIAQKCENLALVTESTEEPVSHENLR